MLGGVEAAGFTDFQVKKVAPDAATQAIAATDVVVDVNNA